MTDCPTAVPHSAENDKGVARSNRFSPTPPPPPTSLAPDPPQPSLNTHAHIHPPYPPQPCRQTGFQAEPPPGCSVINGFPKISLTSRSPRPGRLRAAARKTAVGTDVFCQPPDSPLQTRRQFAAPLPCRAVPCPAALLLLLSWRDRDTAGDPS